jgi:hypothetical protein
MAQSPFGTFLAYTQGNVANVSSLSGTTLGAGSSFGGNARMTDAWVAASDSVVAILADGVPGGAPPPSDDAGDGGGDDAGSPPSADDGGAPTPSAGTLAFNLVPVPDGGSPVDFGSLATPIQFPGNWGSVAALAGRAFVASDGQADDKPVSYRAFDVGSPTPSVVASYAPQGSGPVLYADIAFHQDHLFVAVEREGEITLDVFDDATTTPALLREVPLDGNARIPSTSSVRDGRVAVLATDTRVIVAWTTQESLGPNDATGGFAVFACTTP